jgi:xanthine dehydrogenase large subunit
MPSVGQSLPHESAVGHVTGSAAYIDDLPAIEGEVFVDYAGAPTACGQIRKVDFTAARSVPGVLGFFTARDLPGHNIFGPIFQDEPFLVDQLISYFDQPVVVVAAVDREAAYLASKAIRIEVDEQPPILTIEQAIAAQSFIGPQRKIERGDVEAAFQRADRILEGVLESNGQEQFYFESQACIAIPDEFPAIKVLSSTQNPTETQLVVAEALGLPMHHVICECRRMGGGFGGKETQSAIPAAMAALVAYRLGRPARVVYRKDQDMVVTGKRHPYKTWYRVAYQADGRIQAVDFRLFSNGGAFADLSTSVLERSMLHSDNAYFLPAARIVGQVCRTNLAPNTAFRGFGGPQGVAVIENVMQEIAQREDIDAFDVRMLNLYRDGDSSRNQTPYGQVVRDHVLLETFQQLEETSSYRQRVEAIRCFNQESMSHRKGIACSPIKFGISFTSKFLNQGNALVNVYTDGSVQVSSGGTEMGQGLNTKLQQLVADAFGIKATMVRVMTTSTEKNNNTSPTAASAGTDLNGQATLNACQAIRQRLADFAAKSFQARNSKQTADASQIQFVDGQVIDRRNPSESMPFGQLCDQARRERVDLGARGFYATPGVDFDRETGQGTPFYYYTTGAAVSEVTIDRWTGDVTIDRVDILMDLGKMLNPGIDLGQVVGGFVQGVGWCTTEELRHDSKGRLLSVSPTTYKIPNITDIPKIFNVDTIDNPKHQLNVLRSKAVGEPPLMLGLSVWLAIKDAIGHSSNFNSIGSPANQRSTVALSIPATNEVVLMAIEQVTSQREMVAK